MVSVKHYCTCCWLWCKMSCIESIRLSYWCKKYDVKKITQYKVIHKVLQLALRHHKEFWDKMLNCEMLSVCYSFKLSSLASVNRLLKSQGKSKPNFVINTQEKKVLSKKFYPSSYVYYIIDNGRLFYRFRINTRYPQPDPISLSTHIGHELKAII